MPETHNMAQVVDIYDASDGTVRKRVPPIQKAAPIPTARWASARLP